MILFICTQKDIDEQKKNLEEMKAKDDESLTRSNELRKEKIKVNEDLNEVGIEKDKLLELRNKQKMMVII